MRNVGFAVSVSLALAVLGGPFGAGDAGATDAVSTAPVIRYTLIPNRPVDPSQWLPVTPQLALWPDGRFLAIDPVPRPGAWLLPLLVEGHLGQHTVSDLMARADADGLLSDGGDYGRIADDGPHAPMTELVIRHGAAEWAHTAFALDLGGGETGARRVLADYVAEVVSLAASAGVEPTGWLPDAIAIRAVPIAAGDSDGPALDWPPTGPPLHEGPDCLVVRDVASIDVMRRALSSSRFVDGGQEWRLVARPVLPGVPPC